MQTTNRLLDDLAKVANSAVTTLVGVKDEIEAIVSHRLERFLAEMDVVPRDEFEAIKAVATTARAEQEKLEKRVVELEARLGVKAPRQAKSTTRAKSKPARKKTAKAKAAPPKKGSAARRSKKR